MLGNFQLTRRPRRIPPPPKPPVISPASARRHRPDIKFILHVRANGPSPPRAGLLLSSMEHGFQKQKTRDEVKPSKVMSLTATTGMQFRVVH